MRCWATVSRLATLLLLGPVLVWHLAQPAANALSDINTGGIGTPTEKQRLGTVAYIQGGNLWVKALPDGEPRRLTADGTSRGPRWSPSGRWLALWRGDEVWVMAADGSAARRVDMVAGWFTWSPVDDLLALNDGGALVVERADGSERRELVPAAPEGRGGVGRMAWSADGQWLAYERTDVLGPLPDGRPGRLSSLWRIRADGRGARELVTSGAPETFGLLVLGWAFDDRWVLYVTDPMYSASLLADGAPLLAVPADGGEPVDLGVAVLPTAYSLVPAPDDGGQLAVVDGAGREAWTNKRLVLLAPSTGGRMVVTGPDVAVATPAWSPDGRCLAYVTMPDVGHVGGGPPAREALMRRRIVITDVEGGTSRLLADDPAYRDEFPRWSADGRFILFARLDAADRASLWLASVDGGAPQRVVDELSPNPGPASFWFGFYGNIGWQELFAWWPGTSKHAGGSGIEPGSARAPCRGGRERLGARAPRGASTASPAALLCYHPGSRRVPSTRPWISTLSASV